MNDNNFTDNALTALITLGDSADSTDLSMSVEPNIYFLFDQFTRRADEDDWLDQISKLDSQDLKSFTLGLIMGMAGFWTERFSYTSLALGRELSNRCSSGKGCIDGESLSKFMYGVSAYDHHIYDRLSKLPGLIHDVKILESIDFEKVDTLKKILKARNRVKYSYFIGDPDELTMLEVAREKKYIKEHGEMGGLFEI